jgi:hypothetical protein
MMEARVVEFSLFQKLKPLGLGVLVLAGTALVLKPIERSSWDAVRAGQVELRLESLDGSLGQGVVLGVLGGLRSLVADFAWLELNRKWEARDRVGLGTMVQLVTSIDPRPEFFWINSARMVGYDVPHWRIAAAGGHAALPKEEKVRIIAEQAEQALSLLEKGLRFHPQSAKLKLEVGQVYLNRLRNFEAAAEWFLAASKEAGAPYFVSRLYADLLLQMDRPREAYLFLKEHYLNLPDDPMAQADIVLERILELESILGVRGQLNRYEK